MPGHPTAFLACGSALESISLAAHISFLLLNSVICFPVFLNAFLGVVYGLYSIFYQLASSSTSCGARQQWGFVEEGAVFALEIALRLYFLKLEC
jgi:hypothetical protein